jgi:organic radical activating enzyme
MTALPVNALFVGMQPDGWFAGTPSLVIRLMEHPDSPTVIDGEPLDSCYPLPEWDYDEANEVSLNTLLSRRTNGPQFASVGIATLSSLAATYRERHVLIIGREPGRHDIAPLIRAFLADGRSVQVETTGSVTVDPAGAWVTLRAMPTRTAGSIIPEAVVRSNEVLATVRWKADLDRIELLFANRATPVWLRPSAFAESWVYRQCVAVATRHAGWRVNRPARQPMDA